MFDEALWLETIREIVDGEIGPHEPRLAPHVASVIVSSRTGDLVDLLRQSLAVIRVRAAQPTTSQDRR